MVAQFVESSGCDEFPWGNEISAIHLFFPESAMSPNKLIKAIDRDHHHQLYGSNDD
jgi:hypothetical protein